VEDGHTRYEGLASYPNDALDDAHQNDVPTPADGSLLYGRQHLKTIYCPGAACPPVAEDAALGP
jgi:hypothetical protein